MITGAGMQQCLGVRVEVKQKRGVACIKASSCDNLPNVHLTFEVRLFLLVEEVEKWLNNVDVLTTVVVYGRSFGACTTVCTCVLRM